MGQSYDRRINLYVNIDGKEVKNNVRSINGELAHLINAQKNMTIGSQEYQKETRKIQSLQAILKQHKQELGQIQTPMQKAISTAKGLLPAFGFAAIGAMATQVFGKIMSGTDAMADKWEFSVAAMKNGTDYFWKTLASGDWSNFFSNFREAVKVGYEYSEMLDSVEDKTRSLSMVESDARAEELRLEEALKNKLLSKEDREKAGEQRIQLEKDLAKKRVAIATENFDAEVLISTQRSGLSRENLINIAKDIDSETKVRAEAYNKQKTQLAKLQGANETSVNSPYASVYVPSVDTEEIIKLKKEIDSAPESVKVYAGALNKYGTLTKEMLDRLASSYIKSNEAANSAPENLKKVINLVHTLQAGQDAEGQKLTDNKSKEDLDISIKAIDLAYNQQNLLLKQKYANDETIQKEYHARMLANELAYMQTKLQLTTDESTRIDLQSQIIDKQREFTAALKEATPELLLNRDGINQRNTSLFEEAKLLSLAAQKQSEGTAEMEEYTAKQQMQTEAIQGMSDIMSGYITDALNGSIDEYQTFGDTMILMSLQMLKMMVPIWSAWILGYSLADPISVATVGVKGMINYAIVTGLLYAGISAVEGIVKGGISKKKEAASGTPKHAAGGFTNGAGVFIAGEAGKEFIAPNWMVTNPISGPIIAGLESWRQNPVTISQGAFESTQRPVKSPKFKSSNTSDTSGINVIPGQSAIDPELKRVLSENTKAIKDLMTWKPEISIETYERKRNIWEKLTTGGLK